MNFGEVEQAGVAEVYCEERGVRSGLGSASPKRVREVSLADRLTEAGPVSTR